METRPRRGPVVESKHCFNLSAQILGYRDGTLPDPVDLVLDSYVRQTDAKCTAEIAYGAMKLDGSRGRIFIAWLQVIFFGELADRKKVVGTRAVSRSIFLSAHAGAVWSNR